MPAVRPELPELPALGVASDIFPVQRKHRRVQRVGDAHAQSLDKRFFQRPEPEKSFVRLGAFHDSEHLLRCKGTPQHPLPQRANAFTVYPQRKRRDATDCQPAAVAKVETDLLPLWKKGLAAGVAGNFRQGQPVNLLHRIRQQPVSGFVFQSLFAGGNGGGE